MKKSGPRMTPRQAIETYFGEAKELFKQKLPYQCKSCHKKTFSQTDAKGTDKELTYQKPIMNLSDMIKHARRNHKEVIKEGVEKHE